MIRTIVILLILFIPNTVFAETEFESLIYNHSDIAKIADGSVQIKEVIPDFNFQQLTAQIQSGIIFEPNKIILNFLGLFADEILVNSHVIIIMIVLAIIWGIISNLKTSYSSQSITETSFFAFYSVFLGLIIKGITDCIELSTNIISDQVLFLKTSIPVYMSLVMSVGKVTVASGMEPIFLYFIQLTGSITEKFVLPIMLWISVLNMVNCINQKFSVKKLIDFTKLSIRWGMGIIMTLFIGTLGMTGITSSSVDNLGLKTLRYTMGSFVPMVGGFLSDSVATVLTSLSLIKNVFGIAGIITVTLMCISPLIKMIALMIIYKLAAGIIEPLSDKRLTTMIGEGANAISFMISFFLMVTVMFIIGITIVISAGTSA